MPQIRCECKKLLSYRAEQAGKTVKCPGCAGLIRLPPMLPQDKPVAASPPAAADKPAGQLSPPPLLPPTDQAARSPVEGIHIEPDPEGGDIPLAAPIPTWETSAAGAPPPSHAISATVSKPPAPSRPAGSGKPAAPRGPADLQLELEEEEVPTTGPMRGAQTAVPAAPPGASVKPRPAAARPAAQQPAPQAPKAAPAQGTLGAVKGTFGRFLGGLTKKPGAARNENPASPGGGPG